MTRVDACGACGASKSQVTETRANPQGQLRRARKCQCGSTWTTVECRVPDAARGPGHGTSVVVLPVASLGHVREAIDALTAVLKGGAL